MKHLELAEYKSWHAWENVARVYEAKGDLEKALECMNKVVEINPTSHNNLRLAVLLAKLKRRVEALQAIKETERKSLKRKRGTTNRSLRSYTTPMASLASMKNVLRRWV